MALDIFFQGVASPARIIGAEALFELLPELAFGWPYRLVTADDLIKPFYSIAEETGSDRLVCTNHLKPAAPRRLDPLNALCDLFAALAFALPLSDPGLICLHAAAVRVNGNLLVFPNVRRAGKSTLSVALAAAGQGLVGDDVVPLSFDAEGRAWAHAMGLLPRLRLPLPAALPQALTDLLASAPGPRNRQYLYVRVPDQPGQGRVFPVSAFVILDRQEGPVVPRIEPVPADRAMDALLFQNFARDRHSADVLRRMAGVLQHRPVYRLTYGELASAVACLDAAFSARDAAQGPPSPGEAVPFRLAGLAPRPGKRFLPGRLVCQRAGTERQMIGTTAFLADAEGRAIHRLDPLAATIWDLIAEPLGVEDLAGILAEAFPGTGHGQITVDLLRLMQKWMRAGLIETVASA